MSSKLSDIFKDESLVMKIKHRLPYLFQLAELDSSRGRKVGMEVGSVREKILIALLMYKFGESNVDAKIRITEPEVDVLLFGDPVSVKTVTGPRVSGVKLSWTVDAQKASEFQRTYYPRSDMLLAHVNWRGAGGLYYFPVEAQMRLLEAIGREEYIKLPKRGTNPRGVEISKQALLCLAEDERTERIEIYWEKRTIDYSPYERWIDYWR